MKLGMIGAGFIARFHALALTQVRGGEVAGICSPEGSEDLQDFIRIRKLGTPRIYPSIAELANNVEVLAILAPNPVRVSIMEEIAAAVKSGSELKGVICEKPLGRNVAEARRLVELAAEANLRTAYYENQLYMKPLRSQMQQLELVQKKMGPLSLVRSSEEHAGPHNGWFWDPIQQGGGVLSDMGCHCIAVGWHALTPIGKALTFLRPESVSADVGLLKWGRPEFRNRLLTKFGVDYSETPAEDFATGVITYRNPETDQVVKAQFTNSWMFEKQGLRIFADGMGPGYAFEINTLLSPLSVFIGDEAAESILDAEGSLEKATASRGLLTVQPNEADLYGYTDENADTLAAFQEGRDGMLTWSYGLEITRLVMAAYLSAEQKRTLDLTDEAVIQELEEYVPAIARGEGSTQLF
jgi:predicted dehydrogenase